MWMKELVCAPPGQLPAGPPVPPSSPGVPDGIMEGGGEPSGPGPAGLIISSRGVTVVLPSEPISRMVYVEETGSLSPLPTEPGCTKMTSHASLLNGMEPCPETMMEAPVSEAIWQSCSSGVSWSKHTTGLSDDSFVRTMLFPPRDSLRDDGSVRINLRVAFGWLLPD